VIRSHWFDTHRQDVRSLIKQGDACNVGVVFLLLTIALVIAIFVQV